MSDQILIVGLGSNIRPLAHLRQALGELKSLKDCEVLDVARIFESDPELPAQLIDYTAESWNHQYLNSAVKMRVKNFNPFEFLQTLKLIERKLGRKISPDQPRWAPREIDLDILFAEGVYLDTEELKIPHERLLSRPFALLPVLELLNGDRKSDELSLRLPDWAQRGWISEKPFNTRVAQKYFWTDFMGILNLTLDSFSDGAKNSNPDDLKKNALHLLNSGAQILDLGAESTRPLGAGELRSVDLESEYAVLSAALNVISDFKSQFPEMKISIDCRHPEVLFRLLEKHRIDFMNDVTGFRDPQMRKLAVASQCKVIAMHSLSVPVVKSETISTAVSPVETLNQWWSSRYQELVESGLDRSQIIFDPGIGFGKSIDQNFYILDHLHQLNSLGCPVLIGHSRKSFLQKITQKKPEDRDPETALVTAALNKAYYHFLRVHDVESNQSALLLRKS